MGENQERWMAQLGRPGIAAAVTLIVAAGLMGVGTYGARLVIERSVERREARVVKTLRALTDALLAYQQKFGGFPDTLERLRGREEGPVSYIPPERAGLLETRLARDRLEQDDYVFTYAPTARGQTWAASVPLVGGFVLEARSARSAASRVGFFYADQTGAVRVKRGAPAGAGDPLAP